MNLGRIIQEATTWIEKINNNYENNLYRSPELFPEKQFIYIPREEQTLAINNVIEKRSNILKEAGIELIPIEELHNYGRVMIFDVNSTVCDGAPEDISNYYVDVNDTPPVDTWIALGSQLTEIGIFKDYEPELNQSILAWVPASQYYYANQALLVACVDNFSWPNPENLTNANSDLRHVFTPPDKLEEPTYPINL